MFFVKSGYVFDVIRILQLISPLSNLFSFSFQSQKELPSLKDPLCLQSDPGAGNYYGPSSVL